MKTTKKQLANFAIGLIKEVLKQDKNIKVEYQKSRVDIWFYNEELTSVKNVCLYAFDDLKTNKDKFKKAILKIKGIVV